MGWDFTQRELLILNNFDHDLFFVFLEKNYWHMTAASSALLALPHAPSISHT
jgi:hypothetical protein